MIQMVSRWPLTVEVQFDSRTFSVRYMVDNAAVGEVAIRVHRSSIVSCIPLVLLNYFSTNNLIFC
jgi:hypothetical protein